MSHLKVRVDPRWQYELSVISPEAFRLFFFAAFYVTEWKMDPILPRHLVEFLARSRSKRKLERLTGELEKWGLWVRSGDGWKINEATRHFPKPIWESIAGQTQWDKSAYESVYERDGDACRYCGSSDELTIDHVIPRSRGGTDHEHNLVVCCRPCNSRKGGRTPEQAGMALRSPSREGDCN